MKKIKKVKLNDIDRWFEMAEMENQQDVQEFVRKRQQLLTISNQKQQLQAQHAALEAALKELSESAEPKVYKAIGNILILKDITDVKKELSETVEQADLRVKTLAKQEESLVNRLNKLKAGLEGKLGKDKDDDDEEADE